MILRHLRFCMLTKEVHLELETNAFTEFIISDGSATRFNLETDLDPPELLHTKVTPILKHGEEQIRIRCQRQGIAAAAHQGGKVAVRQPKIEKKPVAYWKAQCGFRNLNQSGTITTLQSRLRDADLIPDRPQSEKHRARESVKDEKNKRKQQKNTSKAKKARNEAWDVTGSWKISCPYMEKMWRDNGSHCSLRIHFTRTEGVSRMWASFDFIAITGVFRFVNPASIGKAHQSRKSHEDEEDEDSDFEEEDEEDHEDSDFEEENDDDEFSQTPTPEEFCLGVNNKPSASCSKWSYRWRGEETGESEIQLYSDKKLCSVTFGGKDGTELSGVFESDLAGKVKFTGRKSGTVVPFNSPQQNFSCGSDIDCEWNGRSERAYEEARIGRWH